jgi:N-acetyl-anhydromuramyl-L-alanine amidase AmpD
MNITKNLVKNFSSREGYKPELIVVHISAGSLTSMTSWFSTPNSQASAHYGISKDGKILQYVEEENKAWHAGRVNNPSFKLYKQGVNPNLYTIGIENEGLDLSLAPQIQLDTLCELIKDVAKRWNIPLDRDHIIGHFQIDAINRPYCPSPRHEIMDKIVGLLKEDTVAVPRKLLEELSKYL